MSISDKISWVGGMMGLFTGFSVISGMEIIYWLWFKVVFNKKSKVAPEDENDTVKKLRHEVATLRKEFADLKFKVKIQQKNILMQYLMIWNPNKFYVVFYQHP